MKILEEFWKGNLNPSERRLKAESKAGKALQRIVTCEEQLKPLLSEEALAWFRKYDDNQKELVAAVEAEAFVIGYKLGARMTQEALEGMDIPDIDEA